MMNQMNMNMNQIGMNNTLMTNFAMDDTAMKIKAIIDPYETKIIELEKKIREKDFEILVLKEKLRTYKNSSMNMNNPMSMDNKTQMGMNMGNQMEMNMNNNQMGMNMGNQMGMNMNNNQMGMNMNNNQMGMNMGNQMGMNMGNQMGMNMNMGNDINMMNQNIMNPMVNPMLINNQPMWMMQYNNFNSNPNFNNQNLILNEVSESTRKINIFFKYKEKIYIEKCNFDEKIQEVAQRICHKMGTNINNCIFISNAKRLVLSLTVAEAGLTDGSTIFMMEHKKSQQNNFNLISNQDEKKEQDKEFNEPQKISILFKTTTGIVTKIIADVNSSIENLIKNYFKRLSLEHLIGTSRIVFIYNALKLNVNDKTKVKDFFKYNINPKIIVNDPSYLIGA